MFDTTNRSDFRWPFLAEKQEIIDWDRYEYKKRRPSTADHNKNDDPTRPLLFRNAETLTAVPYEQRLSFDFDFRPKPISSRRPTVVSDDYPTEKVIEYVKNRAEARSVAIQTRPRIFKCPEISLDDVSADRRDTMCTFVYCTSKIMSEQTSGVPESRPIRVEFPSKPFGAASGKFRPQPMYNAINPAKNWRRVSLEWDESQKRIFGGRSVD